MKKTLAAVAVLGAFAGTAMAANVTLYGVVDEALVYKNVKKTGEKSNNSFSLDSGKQAGSRFGLKGVEELGNGYSVGFVLENGFSADTGSLGNGGRLFGREAILYVQGGFGKLAAGRMGQLTSGNGTFGIAGFFSPFGTAGYSDANISKFLVGYERIDNAIVYQTPSFAGLTFYAQASLKNDSKGQYYDEDDKKLADKGTEGDHSSDRYYALGATYKNGPLNTVFVADLYDYGHEEGYGHADGKAYKDGYSFTLGGSYDFGVVKAHLGAQYFDKIRASAADKDKKTSAVFNGGLAGSFTKLTNGAEGFGVTTGLDVPAFGGTAKVALGYAKAEDVKISANELKRYGVSVGYVYPFSKRTSVYTTASYLEDKLTVNKAETKTKTTTAMVGLTHKF